MRICIRSVKTIVTVTLTFNLVAAALTVGYGQEKSKFDQWDKNGDGKLSKSELPAGPRRNFARVDRNGDGFISRAEDTAFRNRGRTRNSGQRAAATGGLPKLPAGAVSHRDLAYVPKGHPRQKLDLYLPAPEKRADKQRLPLVIWVHGGGWRGGSKANPRGASEMLAAGYAVASLGYRLSGDARFPAAIEDCKAGVSYLRANADKYQLDPRRFAAWGGSAGGHLVALLGTTSGTKQFATHPITRQTSSDVQLVIDWYGPTDFLRMNDVPGRIDHDAADSPEGLFIGGPIQEHKDRVAEANPITYVDKSDPPFLIMHGDKDELVIYNQSELLHAALKKAGVDVTFERIAGGGHGFRGARQTREELVRRVRRFVDQHFKKP